MVKKRLRSSADASMTLTTASGCSSAMIVAGDQLLHRVCGEGVDTGQIDHADPFAFVLEKALRPFDRLPRPVPDDLVDSGELVECHALTHIRIARKRDGVFGIFYAACLSFRGARPCTRRIRSWLTPPAMHRRKSSPLWQWSIASFVLRTNTSTGPFIGALRVTETVVPRVSPRSESRWTTLQSPRINAIVPFCCAIRSVIGTMVRAAVLSGEGEQHRF